MQRLTEEQMKEMAKGTEGFVPPRRTIGDVFIGVLDCIVRVITFGNARVIRDRFPGGMMRWDGIIK